MKDSIAKAVADAIPEGSTVMMGIGTSRHSYRVLISQNQHYGDRNNLQSLESSKQTSRLKLI